MPAAVRFQVEFSMIKYELRNSWQCCGGEKPTRSVRDRIKIEKFLTRRLVEYPKMPARPSKLPWSNKYWNFITNKICWMFENFGMFCSDCNCNSLMGGHWLSKSENQSAIINSSCDTIEAVQRRRLRRCVRCQTCVRSEWKMSVSLKASQKKK